MTSIYQLATEDFGQEITRKRPTQSYNSAGQLELDYDTTTDVSLTLVIVKKRLENRQEGQGIRQVFPAYIIASPSVDLKDWDLIETAKEVFQIVNSQIKADNITGAIGDEPAYYYCDLTYFHNDTTIE